MLLSVVSPAHNEERNLPLLHQRLKETLDGQGIDWEWVVVDDHSSDSTFQVLNALAEADPRVRSVRFSRNFGSHKAILCGLQESRGDCAVVMSSDLQDPPQVILSLIDEWRRAGSQIVWAEREARTDSGSNLLFARLYFWMMRRLVGLNDLPPNGADVFLLDRFVIDTLSKFNEQHVSLVALLSWVGFRQSSIFYRRGERLHGTSSWSLAKKLRLVIDSVTGFSYFPIRLMSGVGVVTALVGFLYALVVVAARLFGGQPEGWSSLMVVLLLVGGVQMVMMGILGEYVWRALDQSRQRPPFVIEGRTPERRPGGNDR